MVTRTHLGPVRSTLARGSGKSHQLVAERDALGQIHADRPSCVFAQALDSRRLGADAGWCGFRAFLTARMLAAPTTDGGGLAGEADGEP